MRKESDIKKLVTNDQMRLSNRMTKPKESEDKPTITDQHDLDE